VTWTSRFSKVPKDILMLARAENHSSSWMAGEAGDLQNFVFLVLFALKISHSSVSVFLPQTRFMMPSKICTTCKIFCLELKTKFHYHFHKPNKIVTIRTW
jgi:hypothetical protein